MNVSCGLSQYLWQIWLEWQLKMMRLFYTSKIKASTATWLIFARTGMMSLMLAMAVAEMAHTHWIIHWKDKKLLVVGYSWLLDKMGGNQWCKGGWRRSNWIQLLCPWNLVFIQALIWVHVGVIQLYCVVKRESINPQSMNTDVVEWIFGDAHQMVDEKGWLQTNGIKPTSRPLFSIQGNMFSCSSLFSLLRTAGHFSLVISLSSIWALIVRLAS